MNFRNRILIGTFLIILAGASLAHAGAMIVTEFKAGSQTGREALSHLTNKGVVAEFLDLSNTGAGKSVGFLIWREILTAISDQAGAGVIIAHRAGEKRVVDMLKANYHLAAVDIAKHQNSPMVLWGIAQETDDKIFISTHLSLIPEIQASDLSLNVRLKKFEAAVWKAEIPRTRFNFGLVESSRSELFNRPIITQGRAKLKAGPLADSQTIGHSKKDQLYQAVDMENEYFKVILENGSAAYLNIWNVAVLPRYVEASRTDIRLRTGPGKNHGVKLKASSFKGSFEVLDMRYTSAHGLWYQIRYDGTPAWVAGFLVRPRFSVPAVHFTAGLYRFRAGRFDEAVREYQMFTAFPEIDEVNTSLATAYQLKGASSLMSKKSSRSRYRASDSFSKAIKLIPYDPAAYNLRAISWLEWKVPVPRRMDNILQDLDQALTLDRTNKRSRDLFQKFGRIIESPSGGETRIFFELSPNTSARYNHMKAKFGPP